MEFETNKPTSSQDIALADAPHVTVEPLHEVTPDLTNADLTNAPAIGNKEADRTFGFEAESTEAAALSDTNRTAHPHHRLAAVIGLATALAFGAVIYLLYSAR